jgi:hypothetical protein
MQGRLAADGGGKAGGTVGLSDERGRAIDATTMKQIEALGRAGNVQGVQSLLNSKGYRASGPWCGVFASRYVSSAGFKPPPGAAVASNWNTWGQGAKPSDINAPGRPFGSMVGSYNVRRYGGGMGRPLGKGQTGGHVVTFMPGSYDPKTGTALSVDQHGYGRRRRVTGGDIDIRYAGDEAVAASRGIDGAISTRRTPSSVAVTVNSNGTKADASAKKSGPDFQEPAVVQKRQLQPTDAQELGY